MWETGVQSLGRENSLEKEMATHYSILACRIPWTEEPGGLQSMGSQRVGHDWATSLSLHQELCSWRALVMGSGLILTFKTPSFQRQLQRGTFQGISKGRGPLNKNPIWCGGIKTETLVSHITCMVDMGHEHEQTPGNMVNKLVTPELTGWSWGFEAALAGNVTGAYLPTNSCIPRRAKTTMKRKRRKSKLMIDFMELIKETTKFRRDAQYLQNPDSVTVASSVSSVQLLSRVRLCDPMNRSTPGLRVHHQLPESTQTHVHCVSDAIQPSHPLSSPSPPALSLSQHQGLFQWVSSPHQVAKVLEFQLQHQSFQWTLRTDLQDGVVTAANWVPNYPQAQLGICLET